MMKATSPAAKSSPMMTEATSASDTNTSALMSKSVTRPMIASRIMGRPQRTMAIHAASKGKGCRPKKLTAKKTPEMPRNAMSRRVPPQASSVSSLWMMSMSDSSFVYSRYLYGYIKPIGVWVVNKGCLKNGGVGGWKYRLQRRGG